MPGRSGCCRLGPRRAPRRPLAARIQFRRNTPRPRNFSVDHALTRSVVQVAFDAKKTNGGTGSHSHPALGFRQEQTRHPFSRRRRLERSQERRQPDAAGPDQLCDILAARFFAQPMKTRDVMAVAEMAIANSAGAGLVFDAVRQAFCRRDHGSERKNRNRYRGGLHQRARSRRRSLA